MIASVLDHLICPSCGGALSKSRGAADASGEILYGVVRCECAEYPIVEGIMSLGTGSGTPEVVDLVKRGDRHRALALSLSQGAQSTVGSTRWVARRRMLGRLAGRVLTAWAFHQASGDKRRLTTDAPLCRILGTSGFETYLKHRFSADSFWPLFALLPLLRQRNGVVLDVGCGIGHASFAIATTIRPRTLFSIDQNFWELFLARRYMSPKSTAIAIDVNGPLPFRDACIDCVVALDMFHYVDSPAGLAREIERVTSQDGLVTMLHVHNALQSNVAAGKPLPPTTWLQLFHRIPVRAFSEPRLVEDFMVRDQLDVLQTHQADEIDAAKAIELIGSRDGLLFRRYERIRGGVLDAPANLRINPIYRRIPNDGAMRLEREFPSEYFRQEYPLSEKYLPPSVVVDGLSAEGDLPRLVEERPELVRHLMQRFVILPLPERYL
jgi:SAM-dependent methyltransferase